MVIQLRQIKAVIIPDFSDKRSDFIELQTCNVNRRESKQAIS